MSGSISVESPNSIFFAAMRCTAGVSDEQALDISQPIYLWRELSQDRRRWEIQASTVRYYSTTRSRNGNCCFEFSWAEAMLHCTGSAIFQKPAKENNQVFSCGQTTGPAWHALFINEAPSSKGRKLSQLHLFKINITPTVRPPSCPRMQSTPATSSPHYAPLTGNDIRLLTIHRSKSLKYGAPDGQIHCTLDHYPLNQPSDSTELKAKLDIGHRYIWDSSAACDVKFQVSGTKNTLRSRLLHRTTKPSFKDLLKPTVNGRYPWGDYVALSYTWGDPNDKRLIIVNGATVEVGANLEAALRVLQEKGPIQAGIKIWIDAVCINQADTDEKNKQVPHMRDIYQRALDVVVWLGEEREESWKAMRLINLLAASWKADNGAMLRECLGDEETTIDSQLPPGQRSLIGCWHALRALMRRPYWSRVWIVQELVMGSVSSPVLCGNETVQFGDLADATIKWIGVQSMNIVRNQMIFERLRQSEELLANGMPDIAPGASLAEITAKFGGLSFDPDIRRTKGLTESIHIDDWTIDPERITYIKRLKFTVGDSNELKLHPANLVALGRSSNATNPRDKIYAFFGLMDSGFTEKINVDYDRSVSQVYTDFSVQWTVNGESLDLLTHCLLEDGHTPTWVPDWTKTESFPLLFIGDHKNPYLAGGRKLRDLYVSPDLRMMVTTGILVDEIDGLSGTEDERSSSFVQPISTANVYGSMENYRDALWRTFLGNRDFKFNIPQASTSFYDEGFRALLDIPLPERGGHLPAPYDTAFYGFIDKNEGFLLDGRPLVWYFANEGRREAVSTDPVSVRMMKDTLLDSVLRASILVHKRRLVTTRQGLVGMVPRAAQRGDVIAILLGCGEPLVLRPDSSQGENSFRVVGTCYVHGIMEGELISEVPLDDIDASIIRLF
ncbi:heterokaryon incompatibility protein-domain-containing protein [Xylariales sp. PMI_506]|nr:heterokaryon incompatibility protein-domain-containing protein [Xylariales sp. PMI_506]